MDRFTLFPIKYNVLYELYLKQRDAYWTVNDIDFTQDVKEWRTVLTDNDKHFLGYVLGFFAQADGIILKNLNINFSMDTHIPEANLFYAIQQGIEAIHWECYSIIIETLIDDQHLITKLFHSIENYPVIYKKAEWMVKWMSPDISYINRLVAFACAEGIFFSSAFASIFFYKKQGLLPGLCLSNKFIARDEGLHRDFGCELFKILSDENKIRPTDVEQIVREAVDIEEQFVSESLNVHLIGLTAQSMKIYVRFVADHLLVSLNRGKLYNVNNPFDWMHMINLSNKQNFFEGRVSEYKKITNNNDVSFNFSDDF